MLWSYLHGPGLIVLLLPSSYVILASLNLFHSLFMYICSTFIYPQTVPAQPSELLISSMNPVLLNPHANCSHYQITPIQQVQSFFRFVPYFLFAFLYNFHLSFLTYPLFILRIFYAMPGISLCPRASWVYLMYLCLLSGLGLEQLGTRLDSGTSQISWPNNFRGPKRLQQLP